MPKGFNKIIILIFGAIGLTGCLSHLASPLTFAPLLVLSRMIYINEGVVGSGIFLAWQILHGSHISKC